ncbi:VhaM9.7-a [Drosophila busckii]|uniref:VhaM9.7-a n=1 Tax=Drosophila busckii TaxID=30019 RepID=A0A0M4EZB5_DROBS|nr:VhaM9.7-a [Drosophila busckii]
MGRRWHWRTHNDTARSTTKADSVHSYADSWLLLALLALLLFGTNESTDWTQIEQAIFGFNRQGMGWWSEGCLRVRMRRRLTTETINYEALLNRINLLCANLR